VAEILAGAEMTNLIGNVTALKIVSERKILVWTNARERFAKLSPESRSDRAGPALLFDNKYDNQTASDMKAAMPR
jgi:hypothetical protein